MSLTFDERIELADRNASRLKRAAAEQQTAGWRIMACYLGHLGEWFVLSVGRSLESAKLAGSKHAAYLESEGPVPDEEGAVRFPRIVKWVRVEKFCPWRKWMEVKAA